MKLAILFGGICLSFRKSLDLKGVYADPRGLTGSEYGALRLAEEFAAMSRGTLDDEMDVTLFTVSKDNEHTHGVKVGYINQPIPDGFDIAISINEPDLLRAVSPKTFRATAYWLNGFTHCQPGFDDHCDLYLSPSAPHLHEIMTREAWRAVAPIPSAPDGQERYTPDPAKWAAVELGCDPEHFDIEEDRETSPEIGVEMQPIEKIPGRVVYCSSPDRGLHWLLQEWPLIKMAVPHATLHIFYRLEPWIRGFDSTPYFPPIEPNRGRALYVQEALARMSDPKWGITLRDSVSRETIEREMAQAEVMAYPCDTLAWSEGFSCSLLEGCAARACPITTDCDALGGVYGDALPLVRRNDRDPREWVPEWRKAVIGALTDAGYRERVNDKARAFAEKRTWRKTAEGILEEIEKRRHGEKAA
jgi:hypothetical protein